MGNSSFLSIIFVSVHWNKQKITFQEFSKSSGTIKTDDFSLFNEFNQRVSHRKRKMKLCDILMEYSP